MADRDDKNPDRSFGPDATEQPHRDLHKTPTERPLGRVQPVPEQRDVTADDVMTGDRHAAALAESNQTTTDPHGRGFDGDQAAAPPSGSARSAVETPRSDKSRKMLMGAVAAVVVILLLLLLFSGSAEATSPLLTMVSTR